ncbi:MAG: ChbG/HpnK family deacetylase [Solirubrobacterales bacterium]
MPERCALIITADDFGYSPRYDEGIVEAADAGAVDSVSVMVNRNRLDPEPLLETGVETGLHLDLPLELTEGQGASAREREAALRALAEQLEAFEAAIGHPPAYLDGHRHCHAHAGLAAAVAREARQRGLPVRSIDAAHRRILRREGAATPDRLIGRYSEEAEAALPVELQPVVDGEGELPTGVTEWMVHPGHADPESGSGYDRAREEDLDLLLSLCLLPALRGARLTHVAVFG